MTNDYHQPFLLPEAAPEKKKELKKKEGVVSWSVFRSRRSRNFPNESPSEVWQAFKNYLDEKGIKNEKLK